MKGSKFAPRVAIAALSLLGLGFIALASAWLTISAKESPATPRVLPKSCSEMDSCPEALESLAAGNYSLDSDGDGVPCESICHDRKI